jgi:large subunit ribosomal protein L25
MKLKVMPRTAQKKSEVNKLRREGFIPAIIYHKDKAGETIYVQNDEFSAYLRAVQPGRLSTTVFTLVDSQEKSRRVIIKDIQYNVVNYNVIHLDFEELIDGLTIKVKVPIECVGAAESPGVKLGGALRQVIRSLRVRCQPKDIPAFFSLDVKALNLRQSKRLSDLDIPNEIRPLANLKEVAAVIVKR